MVKKINVAIIGCGYWGTNLIRVFSQVQEARLYNCCDMDVSKLKNVQSIYAHFKITNNYNDVVNDENIDAIIIATPVGSHYELAKKALINNKHVWVEKPMTLTVQEAEDLIRVSKERNRILMVDHTFEYHAAIWKIKEIIAQGMLGNIYYINANWLNLGLLQPEVNVVSDLATHIFSIINFITGHNPLSISAIGEGYIRKDIEETATLVASYPNKILANIRVSWLEPCKIRTITVVGSKKMLVFDLLNAQEVIKIYDQGVDINSLDNRISYRSGDIYSPKIPQKEPLAVAAEHFIECIKTGQRPLSDGEGGLNVVKILELANKSLKNNGVEVRWQ